MISIWYVSSIWVIIYLKWRFVILDFNNLIFYLIGGKCEVDFLVFFVEDFFDKEVGEEGKYFVEMDEKRFILWEEEICVDVFF